MTPMSRAPVKCYPACCTQGPEYGIRGNDKIMATADEMAMLGVYQRLMVEAKERAMSINALTGDQRGIPSPLVHEYGILQIRMLCEIIRLSCLVAHGDLVAKAKPDLRKAFAPGQIFAELEKMHDDFYPVPMKPEKTEYGWHMAEYDGAAYMTKSEVAGVWGKCGDVLHRGHLKKLLKTNSPVQNHFLDLQQWGQKIMNLLSAHRIITQSRNLAFVCLLEDSNGEVNVALGEAGREPDPGLTGNAA